MELTTLPSQQVGINHFTALYEVMLANGDTRSADKILDIYEKWKNQEYVVSFAGHFSAGKSTMVNTLLEKDILPESPIPTSANVVKITSGRGAARIFFHDQAPVEYQEPYDMETIKNYCKDKNNIKKVEISTSLPVIPENTALFDTPGIDAADDADRLMTEASMHLVDLLVYVMDYNHVQSEVNLQFMHTLNEKRIPFFVVINQIDKHDDKELSFTAFEASIKQTFTNWNIHPEAIYYSSLIDERAAYNQFPQLKKNIVGWLKEKRGLIDSIANSIRDVVEEHKRELIDELAEKMASFPDQQLDTANLYAQRQAIEQQIHDVEAARHDLEQQCREELDATLKNAYLMPHDLREKAAAFLEAQQQDFKIGMFGSKKKTQAEREIRQATFLQALSETMETAIQWKLRDKFTNLLKQYGITDQALFECIQQLAIDYTTKDLAALINPGAKVNGQSVLHYTNEVSQDIKQKYRSQAKQLWEQIDGQLTHENKKKQLAFKDELDEISQLLKQQETKNTLQQTLLDKQYQLEELLQHPGQRDDRLLDQVLLEKQQFTGQRLVHEQVTTDVEPFQEKSVEPESKRSHSLSSEDVCTRIDQTLETINGLPGFQTVVTDLTEKRERLIHQSYTIALFGAFSAGKSSFANALLGDLVLPVSPNPTTAAINRICPVTETYPHGSVVVHMKHQDVLFEDLAAICRPFAPAATDFAGLLQWVKDNDIYKNKQLKQLHQSYLQAMLSGYPEHQELLGDSISISLDDFAGYVSDETKACFVESIDVYYDCAITKQGITLVDTPGADSINSRHTNVAFDYIKYADAMCFVTYYNHALSRADQDFLMQLGRIKDSFQLDKMFFIVNAADLAKDEMELRLVTEYIEEQLLQFGIRFPKLFPVSSKQALQARQQQLPVSKKMRAFEQEFYAFIQHDLASLSIQAALLDIRRAYQVLTNYIASASLNEQEKDQYRTKLLTEQETLQQVVNDMDTSLYQKQIAQKLDKQLYYVMERLGIRFHDMFKEFFNPATITETGKQATIQLQQSLNDLLDYAGYELVQELRAVSLRIEAYMRSLAEDAYTTCKERAEEIDQQLLLPGLSSFDFSTPEYEQAFQKLDKTIFQKSLSLFKGTKAFFAKNEKELMKDEIYQTLVPYVESYMEENKAIMLKSYQEQWKQLMENMQQETMQTIRQSINDALSVLEETIDISHLQAKQQELETIMSNEQVS
ncbi:dynamin family protein [Lentibacillus sp. N15]|uniref:dynamin family protein n=1 Tax=Lentibacillus songyuanensis TaxID=3136161 RepID=UPI0031BB075D